MPDNAFHATTAGLSVMADHVERYQQEVADLVPGFQMGQHDDVAIALVEAERALRSAARCLRRSAKLADEAR
ncbi:MAG: hypothetical protein K8R99_14285 [Actinomycetia bacterium]|nr:hypothetical protein [Actinomycetes bacterium]